MSIWGWAGVSDVDLSVSRCLWCLFECEQVFLMSVSVWEGVADVYLRVSRCFWCQFQYEQCDHVSLVAISVWTCMSDVCFEQVSSDVQNVLMLRESRCLWCLKRLHVEWELASSDVYNVFMFSGRRCLRRLQRLHVNGRCPQTSRTSSCWVGAYVIWRLEHLRVEWEQVSLTSKTSSC